MRILHTSDWHLGQHFMGKTRQAEHQAFCRWLIEQVRERQVDAVLIAGDVFDTGAPPSYAREQYNQFIVELREAGASLVVLGGNHDSVAMLGESRTLLAQLDTRVVPSVGGELDEQVLVLKHRSGAPGAIPAAPNVAAFANTTGLRAVARYSGWPSCRRPSSIESFQVDKTKPSGGALAATADPSPRSPSHGPSSCMAA